MLGQAQAEHPEWLRLALPKISPAAGAQSRGHGQPAGPRDEAEQKAPWRGVSPAKPLRAFLFDLGHVSL